MNPYGPLAQASARNGNVEDAQLKTSAKK